MTPTKTPTKQPVLTGKAAEIFKALLTEGVPLYLTQGLAQQDLDALYVSAYNLYAGKEYAKAFMIFEGMIFYNHFDKRGWVGCAACCQVLQRYERALFYYSHASLLDGQDPLPVFYAAECYIALKRYAEARAALETLKPLVENKPEFAHFQSRLAPMSKVLPKS